MTEVFKAIPGYIGMYEVSNLGRVKSLKFNKHRILKLSDDGAGYHTLGLSSNNITKTFKAHQLVAMAFLNHKPKGHKLVVNHINFNKKDNRVENLEIVTARQNSNRKHLKSSSKYTGVCWKKVVNKWVANISVNGKKKHLGYFDCELSASKAYNNMLKNIIVVD